MPTPKIRLGSRVECRITGFTGTVIAYMITVWSTVSYQVQPGLSSGAYVEPRWFNEALLKIIEEPPPVEEYREG